MEPSTLLAIVTTTGAALVAILSALQKFRFQRVNAHECVCNQPQQQEDELVVEPEAKPNKTI